MKNEEKLEELKLEEERELEKQALEKALKDFRKFLDESVVWKDDKEVVIGLSNNDGFVRLEDKFLWEMGEFLIMRVKDYEILKKSLGIEIEDEYIKIFVDVKYATLKLFNLSKEFEFIKTVKVDHWEWNIGVKTQTIPEYKELLESTLLWRERLSNLKK